MTEEKLDAARKRMIQMFKARKLAKIKLAGGDKGPLDTVLRSMTEACLLDLVEILGDNR